MKRFVVVGLGIFGSGVAEALYEQGHDVVAIDLSEEKVSRIARRVTEAIVGDATSVEALERVGAGSADAAVVSTGDDMSASILATLALRDLNVREIYIKVISFDHARIMRKIGVTDIIFPEREAAFNLSTRIARSQALLNYVRIGTGLSLQEMAIPVRWEGRTLRELKLPSQFRVSVVALR
ncbi:MAG TPA: TrkA family potassium uptake protein, partial [Rhodothermales bacterium]